MKLWCWTLIGLGFIFAATPLSAQVNPVSRGTCTGQFVNPISDVCWECIGPITLGSAKIYDNDKSDFGNPGSPICACAEPVPRIGLAIGFWEPVRLADVSREPWCFVNLGGHKIDFGFGFKGKTKQNPQNAVNIDNWHVHWYNYPLLYWLELATDFLCLEQSSFDIAYVTELDPLWNEDGLAAIINPEVGLFANPLAQAVCAADCGITTAFKMGRRELFWCMGCNGGSYPMTGNIAYGHTDPQSAILAAERMAYKQHRMLLAYATAGDSSLCRKDPMPIMDKRMYRWQMVNPVAITKGPFTCPSTGYMTQLYHQNTVKPLIDKDLGYLVWRKRNCCAL